MFPTGECSGSPHDTSATTSTYVKVRHVVVHQDTSQASLTPSPTHLDPLRAAQAAPRIYLTRPYSSRYSINMNNLTRGTPRVQDIVKRPPSQPFSLLPARRSQSGSVTPWTLSSTLFFLSPGIDVSRYEGAKKKKRTSRALTSIRNQGWKKRFFIFTASQPLDLNLVPPHVHCPHNHRFRCICKAPRYHTNKERKEKKSA